MRKLKFSLLIVFFSSFAFVGCDSDDDAETDFPNGTGIKGRVNVQNEFQQPLYSERNGISVLFEVGFQTLSVQADAVGQYILEGAPLGTYTISLSKPGFGTAVESGIPVSNVNPQFQVEDGFQKLPTFTITKLPVTSFTDLELILTADPIGDPPNQTFEYTLTLDAVMNPAPPPTGQSKGYRVFIGTDEFVSPEEYVYQEHRTSLSENINLSFDNAWFEELGLESGDELHAVMYGDANFNLEVENEFGALTFPNISAEVGGMGSVLILP